MLDHEIEEARAIAADLEARLKEGSRHDMALSHTGHQVALLLPYLRHLEATTATPEPAAAQSGWVSCADMPHILENEFLYVLLPDGTVTQAMYQDFFTNELEGMAWGHYTDVDVIDPLPVQPTHFFTPPTPPAQ